MIRNRLGRLGLTAAAATTAVVLGAGPAMAHHCYIPMYSLNGPASANWLVISAEEGAMMEAGYAPKCQGAVDAGYAALRAEKMPVGIKIKISMTIGDPKDVGRMNPNGADGLGLEYFGAGSTLANEMLDVWIAGAQKHSCS